MERDVIQAVTLLVGKEGHGKSLPVLGQHERGAFFLTVVGRPALDNRVDGHIALRLESERVVGGIGEPLGRLQLESPRRIRKIGHGNLYTFASIDAEAHHPDLLFELGRAIGVIPDIPTAVAIRQVAVGEQRFSKQCRRAYGTHCQDFF